MKKRLEGVGNASRPADSRRVGYFLGSGPDGSAAGPPTPFLESDAMADLVLVVLTIAVFAVLGLIASAVERL
ncbi:hypothetical protein [Actinomadura rayongensis]